MTYRRQLITLILLLSEDTCQLRYDSYKTHWYAMQSPCNLSCYETIYNIAYPATTIAAMCWYI